MIDPDSRLPFPLRRYREAVPDWKGFREALLSPEPTTIRARSLLQDPGRLRATLEARGFTMAPIEGLPDYLEVVEEPHPVAMTREHWLGRFHVQQSVMALPTMALGPRPGERVLDLCAAPGGKTAHLAEMMEDRGPLVAVDPKEKRLRGLMANTFRLGHPNVLVVAADGRELPGEATFDRVLADVPCSAEGNVRRQGGRLPQRTREFQVYVSGLQESLLRRAIALTRPGGTLVYSTCTFAPEENEAVVSRVLADCPVRAEPIPLDLPHASGLPEWEDATFHPGVRHAWRVYPHHLDSGGLFMIRLLKEGKEAEASGWTPIPLAFPGEEEKAAENRIVRATELLEPEYGFASTFRDEVSWMVRSENIWLHTAGDWPQESWSPSGSWRTVAVGLRGFRSAGGDLENPSNTFLTRFGRERASLSSAPRHREVTREELLTLLRREPLPPGELLTGPVVVTFQGDVLGRAMVGRPGLRLEIPRAQARRLRRILEMEEDSES